MFIMNRQVIPSDQSNILAHSISQMFSIRMVVVVETLTIFNIEF